MMLGRSIAVVMMASVTAGALATSAGCLRHGGFGLFEAALVTAAIVSSVQPPPPRVVFVPEPRDGFVWQPGFWTRQDGDWVWVDGGWVEARSQARFVPTHWEQGGDGQWTLVQGQWVAM